LSLIAFRKPLKHPNIFLLLFKKSTSRFTTTCEVIAKEETHLFESGGNFGTEAVLKNQKAIIIIKNSKD